MAVYHNDEPEFLRQSIDSILEQSLPPNEVVIVKDGPVPSKIEQVLSLYRDAHTHIRVVSLPENRGLGEALREGLKYCTHDIVARMDSDDIALPERFCKQVSHLCERRGVAACGTHIYEFEHVPGSGARVKRVPSKFDEVKRYAKFRNPLNHPSVVFRKEAILKVGSYKHMPLFEDYYLWLRLLRAGYVIENLDEPLLYFRIGRMLEKRQGMHYFRKEISFFNTLRKERLITTYRFLILIGVRLPFRVLPKRWLGMFYKNFLRDGGILNRFLGGGKVSPTHQNT